MRVVSNARAWVGDPGLWLDGLRRLNSAEPAVSPAFDRRRGRLLRLGSGLILISALPWACYFAALGRLMPALCELACVLAAALVLALTQRRLLRLASLLFTGSGMLCVIALALAVDVPHAGVPRSAQLFLIPLTVAAFFLLQNEGPPVRIGLPLLGLGAFVVLTASPASFGFTPLMDAAGRGAALWFVATFTALALYAVMVVMLREAKESSALEEAFTQAIEAGEIETYLQPQCAADGRILGAEALMRWRHPQRGYISPAEFIPMAERTGLIIPAGEQVLAAVCAALQRWEQDPLLRSLSLSVNVSPAQLLSGGGAARLIDKVPAAVAARGVLKFELTESMFVRDYQTVHAKMARIRAHGIRIALDDFGTGFSSLNYLKQLPLDQLKVDQTFVHDLPENVNAGKIARTIVQLGQDLGLEVVAEGTESLAQVAALQEMGCQVFQGYLFSRPLPIEAFERLARDVHLGRRSLAPQMAPAA